MHYPLGMRVMVHSQKSGQTFTGTVVASPSELQHRGWIRIDKDSSSPTRVDYCLVEPGHENIVVTPIHE